ncbi:MAG: AAA family ATPase [Hyphomicrobiales bacterium]|nr:AAA family ATPase [Hyphomicrobiales bacterium]MCP5374266.1 AAA family ATPase [Hyphomicrobiales bacterium]
MLSVLVTNTKGGCGKTTLATNLAAAFANAGHATVIADCDRQRSSLAWAARRPIDDPPVTAVDWSRKIADPAAGTTRLVIDAPAAMRRGQVEELVRLADLIVLPVLPSFFDEGATRKFIATLDKMKPVRKGKRAVAVVGNRIKPRTRSAAGLEHFLNGIGHHTVALLRDTQMYPAVAAQGRSLFDLRGLRARGFLADWLPLLTYLDETTSKMEQ